MKSTPEILQAILLTVHKIHQSVSAQQGSSGTQFGGSQGSQGSQGSKDKKSDGKKMVNIAQSISAFSKVNKKTRNNYLTFMDQTLEIARKGGGEDFESFSSGVSILSTSLGRLPIALEKFRKVNKKTVNQFTGFMNSLLDIVSRSNKKTERFQTFSEGISTFSSALPTLYSSIKKIGGKKMSSREDRAIKTIKKIYNGVADIGSRRQKTFNRGIDTLYNLSYALRSIERPITKLSWVLGKIGISLVVFAGSLLLVQKMLRSGSILGSLAVMTGVITYIGGMFFLLGKVRSFIEPGINTANKIGIGFLILTGGILGFVGSLFLINKMLGTSQDASGVWQSMAIMGLVIAGIIATFTLLGVAKPLVDKGIGVTTGMGVALGILAIAILGFSVIGRLIMEMNTKEEGEDKKHGMVTKGLGIMGLVILGLVGTFALLGAPYVAEFVAIGSAVSILMSAAIFVLASAIKKLVNVASELPEGEGVKTSIGDMIYGVVGGFASGIARGLYGDEKASGTWDVLKKGLAGAGKFALIMASIPMLTGISIALTAFAHSLKAFQKIGKMTIIKGTDKNGKPIFGETVDVDQTSQNIATSISTFIGSMIDLTKEITLRKAVKLKLLGKALTGKNGVLKAAIDFTEVLKSYAEFGKKGEIGYEYQGEDGEKVKGAVKIGTVVDHIVNSFGTFINKFLTKMGEGDTLDQFKGGLFGGSKRKLIRLTKALVGDHGIFKPMIEFTKLLKEYAQFGKKMEVGYKYIDDEGNEHKSSVSISAVTDTILTTFSTFLTLLFNKIGSGGFLDQFKGGLLGGTKRKIIRMTKALTGKHGLLKPMIQFADLLKTYASADPDEIRYKYMDGDKEVTGTISIKDTTKSIIGGIKTFINKLTDKFGDEFGKGILEKGLDALTGKGPMVKLRNLTDVLTGDKGILSPITEFTKMIKDYAQFQKESDKDMETIATNIVSGVQTFIHTLKEKADNISSQGSDIEKIQESFEKTGSFFTTIKKLNEATTGLDKISSSIKELGNGIGMMAENLDKLNTDKMDKMADIASGYLQETNSINKSSERVANKATKSGTKETYNEPSSPEYKEKEKVVEKGGSNQAVMSDEQINKIANEIGNTVGEKVAAALQNGQFLFEFDTTKAEGASGKYFFEPE